MDGRAFHPGYIADVRARSWEEAFELTNSWDEQDWYERAEVTLRVDPDDPRFRLLDLHPLHSTSVGDVLVAKFLPEHRVSESRSIVCDRLVDDVPCDDASPIMLRDRPDMVFKCRA